MGSTGFQVSASADTHRFVLDNLREHLPDGHHIVAHCRAALGTGRHGAGPMPSTPRSPTPPHR